MNVKTTRKVDLGPFAVGGGHGLFLICGPCVIESRDVVMEIAEMLAEWSQKEAVPLIFKASYDKANRTSLGGFRGPGLEEGLAILQEVKSAFGLPILTDIHLPEQAAPVSEVADILQIPAFLCRQTDLLLAAAATKAVVNVKKGQFLAPGDMGPVVEKLEEGGGKRIMLTERGSSFGYNNLVVDMRGLVEMREFGYPVIFDATHSVQRPGAGKGYTAGDGDLAPYLARAAAGVGVDGFFIETHVRPEEAQSDRENLIPFARLPRLWGQLQAIAEILQS
ncbi:MAG: 3-deoxy-8-phosphooctulonate synthase [Verrucomicrobia bacterium]|nr:3-deoxy-8-phosphooctulonate synthase [Verrucomicrobiota bacterium]MCH8512158.1 3-deoxy-8-phosphooctulonate synthase [Kiritimatiellia bacterium]